MRNPFASSADEAAPISFGSRLTQLADERPEDVGLIFAPAEGDPQNVNWSTLERRSLQLAGLLAELGVGPDSTVAIGLPNSPEHFYASFATTKLGACTLPLRWDLPAWERDRLLEVAKPTVVIADWPDLPVQSVSLAELHATQTAAATPLPDRVAMPARAIASSGSTGHPKIIVSASPGEAVLEEQPRVLTDLIPAPLYHTNGFALALRALFNGDRVVVMERFDAARVVDLIERYRVDHVTMVSTMLLRIARLPGIETRDFSSLEFVLQGGAPCPAWLVRKWIELLSPQRFIMSYGSTEQVGVVMIDGEHWLERPGSVGLPIDTELRILDDAGREQPPGEIGEIYMRSLLMEGPSFEYRGADPAKSTDDGLICVGDLGWVDEEGYLFIADRRTDMIVSGGANIYPAEIEAALTEHPDVVDAVVVGLPDPEWGRRVAAVLQLRRPGCVSEDALHAHCRERLAAYKVPKVYDIVERLPRSESGKLNRNSVAAECEARLSAAVPAPGPDPIPRRDP